MKAIYTLIFLAALEALALLAPLHAAPYDLSYGGRITDGKGKPLDGPVELQVSFYRTDSGGSALSPSPVAFSNVALKQGVYAVTVSLTPAEFHQIFPSTDQLVYVEIKDVTHDITFPRQQLTAIPYALKIPIDDLTLGWDSNGKLKVNAENLNLGGTNAASLNLSEAGSDGTPNKISLKAPAGVTTDVVYTFPGAPQAGKFLMSDASGTLSWGSPAGSGDMQKSTYDSGNNGKVDVAENSEKLGGALAATYLNDSTFGADGLMTRTGAGTYSIVADNSSNWNTAHTDRLKWDGGATGLNAATARTSLGLGGAATLAVGTSAGTVAAGDDSRLTGAVQGPASATDNGIVRFDGTTGKLVQNSTNVVIGDDGKVGIGTTSPAGILEVAGGTASGSTNGNDIVLRAQNGGTGGSASDGGSISLNPGMGSNGGVDGSVSVVGLNVNGASVEPILDVSGVLINAADNAQSINLQTDIISSGSSSNRTYTGIYGRTSATPLTSIASVTSSNIELYLSTSAANTVNTAVGLNSKIVVNSLASATVAKAIRAGIEQGATGTVASAYGLAIEAPVRTAGTMTTYYGVHIATPTAATTNYALYSAGGTNYFGGNVGIGTTSPDAKLSVSGGGATLAFTVQNPANQSTVRIGDQGFAAGGTVSLSMDGNNAVSVITAAHGLGLGNANGISWVPNSTLDGNSADTGLRRNTAGVLEVNNGTAGQYRDLQVRAINPTSGNVGIGTTSPQSALQVTGYVQLDLTVGSPPVNDCNDVTEYGRMKVDAVDVTTKKLWICTAAGWLSTALN